MSLNFMDVLDQRVEELAKDYSVRSLVFNAADERNFSVAMDLIQSPW
jgi:enoyl-CoA hydratase/carnithine racemase